MNGNDRADRLAVKATLTNGLLLEGSEVLRSLRHYLRAQSQGHHTINHLEERGVKRGSARRSFLTGREWGIVNQTKQITFTGMLESELDGSLLVFRQPSQ